MKIIRMFDFYSCLYFYGCGNMVFGGLIVLIDKDYVENMWNDF